MEMNERKDKVFIKAFLLASQINNYPLARRLGAL